MKKFLNWYKLDNSAKLYPILITKNSQSLFRLSALLIEEIDEERLSQALSDIMPRFPSFAVRLRNGVFWYYLEENNRPTKVFRDDGIMLKPIDIAATNHYWFRVSYFSKKINIDFFHALTDASGGMEFFKALLHRYMTLGGQQIGNDNVLEYLAPSSESEMEDSFQTNYQKTRLKDLDLKSFTGIKPMFLEGKLLNGQGYGAIIGTMSASGFKEKAKQLNTGLNTLICALLMQSIAKTYETKLKKKPIVMMIPVNLHRVFGGNSLRNFVLFTRLCIMPSKDKTLEDYIKECAEQLAEGTKKENIQKQLNTTVRSERAAIFQFMPLPLKYFAFKVGKLFLKARQTMIFSNVGKIDIPQNMTLEKLAVNINVSRQSPVNVGAITVNDKLVISFTRNIVETEIERNFFTTIASLGLDVQIASNFREEQNVL
ncbi:MAG TPA: hypothetical protein VJZ69_00735 [Clostridia bacterium]|nr:hypothetical protein [Clostridia bacterium]